MQSLPSSTPPHSPTTPPSSAPSSQPTGTVPIYGQCGGIGYTGPTVCAPPNVCKVGNREYSYAWSRGSSADITYDSLLLPMPAGVRIGSKSLSRVRLPSQVTLLYLLAVRKAFSLLAAMCFDLTMSHCRRVPSVHIPRLPCASFNQSMGPR